MYLAYGTFITNRVEALYTPILIIRFKRYLTKRFSSTNSIGVVFQDNFHKRSFQIF
jgi:hypothetical protein